MTVVAGIVSRDRQRIVGLVAAAYHRAAVDDIAVDGERIDKVQVAQIVNMAVHRGVVAAKGGVRGDINRLRAPAEPMVAVSASHSTPSCTSVSPL